VLKFRFLLLFMGLLCIPFLTCAAPDNAGSAGKYNKPPEMTINVNKKYIATIKTEKGDIVVELYPDKAPITVNNFVFLSREGYYNGTTFHRVIPGFMAQGGDPTGTGSGGPGYTFEDEKNDLKHETGVMSMANRGANTNGSQFFITYAPQHHLDGVHTIFGKVIDGMSVLNSLSPRDPAESTDTQGNKILTITIAESD
jgi:peptidyl-prolyl cis-trans isomerase B (cyclophilin B)